MRAAVLLLASVALAGCAATPPVVKGGVPLLARAETEPVGTANADAADDPAIWRNPAEPAQSLIVATDKKAGLHVYGLDGRPRSFVPAGQLNNVDLVTHNGQVIVAASERNDLAAARLQLYRLDTVNSRLEPFGSVTGGAGEAYGVCLHSSGGQLHAFSVLKPGIVHQVRLETGAGAPTGTIVRTMRLRTQTEGCVVDPRTGTLYVGEEDVGIWRFGAGPSDPVEGQLVAPIDGRNLFADVEGLALVPAGDSGGYLVASSQGDYSFTVYALPDMRVAGRFHIAGGTVGSVEETDGIEIALGDFGPDYPSGLMVAQDGMNEPRAQNFKLISWADVIAALGLQD